MGDELIECLCGCMCQIIWDLIFHFSEDSTVSNNSSSIKKMESACSNISKVNYIPLPVGPMGSVELPRNRIHQLTLPHSSSFLEAELIISTNESAFSMANSTPQALFSSIRADAIEHRLALHLAKQKFEEFTDSRVFNKEYVERLLQSLDKEGQCHSSLLSLAVILSGDFPPSVKAEMVFELYRERNNPVLIKGTVVYQMVAHIFTVSVRHLPKLVHDKEEKINEVINYCNMLEKQMHLDSRHYASLLLAWKLELSRSEFMIKVQDQFSFLLSSSEIRKEIILNCHVSSSH